MFDERDDDYHFSSEFQHGMKQEVVHKDFNNDFEDDFDEDDLE